MPFKAKETENDPDCGHNWPRDSDSSPAWSDQRDRCFILLCSVVSKKASVMGWDVIKFDGRHIH